ncbi:hypothetical protein SDC9_155339 [bioreactor metagenome]|uniref:Uncharacterized protein n=1 Tax=bioreactor metagenome TaxID=1076179 RepID=A0A645F6F7_9ZZZZ
MAQHDGRGARPVAIDDGQVGMADTRGGHAHQYLARAGRRQVHLPDFHRFALRIGRGCTGAGQYGCSGLHHHPFKSLQVLLESGLNALSPGMVLSTL